MFNSTLVGNARNWFSKLPRRSIDGFEELRRAFLDGICTRYLHSRETAARTCGTTDKATQTTGHMSSPGDNPMTRVAVATTATAVRGAWTAGDKLHPITNDPKGEYSKQRQKGHTTNECVQLRQLIDQLVKEGRLDHLVKNIKEGKDKQRSGGKKDAPRDKAETIYMTTQRWSHLPSKIMLEGHDIHRMYIDGGASADILYEHCFQRLRPEVKSQLNLATTSLTGFTGEKIWPVGVLRFKVMVGNKEHSTIGLDGGCVRTLAKKPRYFAWEPNTKTGVPRSITEHKLKITSRYSPVQYSGVKSITIGMASPPNPVMVKRALVAGGYRTGSGLSLCGYPASDSSDRIQRGITIQCQVDEEKYSLSQSQGVYAIKCTFGLKKRAANHTNGLVPIQVGRQVTPMFKTLKKVYEEGRLPNWTTEAEINFNAAHAAYCSTSHDSRSRPGEELIYIFHDEWRQ
ncbi:hypothetical protein Tco_0132668 [Tanacetum coccineum]